MDDILIVARNKTHVQKLKAQFKKEFDMKDLRETKKILGIEITRYRGSGRFCLFQENYVLQVLERFNMVEVRLIITRWAGHFKLSSKQCPQHRKRRRCLKYHMLVQWDHSCMLWSALDLT